MAFKDITLRTQQQFEVVLHLSSEANPGVDVYWMDGEDDPKYQQTGAGPDLGAEQHLMALLKNLAIAIALPPAITGMALLLAAGFQGTFLFGSGALSTASSGTGVMLGALVQLYFYLRALPHAIALYRILGAARRPTVAGDYSLAIIDSHVLVRDDAALGSNIHVERQDGYPAEASTVNEHRVVKTGETSRALGSGTPDDATSESSESDKA